MSRNLRLTTENFQYFKEQFPRAQVARDTKNNPVGVDVTISCVPDTEVVIDQDMGTITFRFKDNRLANQTYV